MDTRLAIEGGSPAIPDGLPAIGGGPGSQVLDEAEISAVTDLLRKAQLFRHGPDSQVRAFEKEAADWIGVRHALMVNSGTSALVCGLHGLGVGPGDEVIVPGYTYIATAAAVASVGAVPIIAEIDESLALDPREIAAKRTPRTRAVIPVYMQGVPGRVEAIMKAAGEAGLDVLEDCCQAIGARYRGRVVGTFGKAGAWSLNYFKVITCGEGGLVFTDDYRLYERACFASDPALPMWMRETIATEGWEEAPFSANCFRPSELLGGIARAQLAKLEGILRHTRSLKRTFLCALEEPRGYTRQHVDDPEGDCGISAAILVRDAALARRYAQALTAEGLPCGTAHNEGFPDRHIYRFWDSILDRNWPHPRGGPWKHPAYQGDPGYAREMCPRTLDLLSRALRFGFNMRMTPAHAEQMARAINKVDRALGG